MEQPGDDETVQWELTNWGLETVANALIAHQVAIGDPVFVAAYDFGRLGAPRLEDLEITLPAWWCSLECILGGCDLSEHHAEQVMVDHGWVRPD